MSNAIELWKHDLLKERETVKILQERIDREKWENRTKRELRLSQDRHQREIERLEESLQGHGVDTKHVTSIYTKEAVKMYILTDKPESSGTYLAEAFDAIDQAFGTEEFSEDQAIEAILTIMAIDRPTASTQFRRLVAGDYVTEV